MALKKVYEPIRLRNLELKNRIVRTAHGTYLSTGLVMGGEDFLGYHLARAQGGVGLSIFESGEVHKSAWHGASLADDRVIPNYQAIAKAVRPYGMRLFQQLWHGGHHYTAFGGSPAWGVSTVPGVFGGVPLAMTIENIEELIGAYAAAAVRCKEGNLDGVEIHVAHGYLPHQFLSPVVNTRTDRYGGSLENRMRFAQEVLRAVRKAVGDDFVVGMRIGASETPGSIKEPELQTVIKAFEAEKLVDFVNASVGDYFKLDTLIGGMEKGVGYGLPSSTQLTKVAKSPRIVVGRFRTLEEVEQVLNEGVADMVSMVRAHIADPDLVRKTQEGKVDQIRPCIACNQGCQGGIWRNHRLGCAVNPAAGFEVTLAENLITRVATPKKVLVVGGGPGGLEAARTAALRGHKVVLAEASSVLGGALAIAKHAPRFHQLGDIVYWHESELRRLDVEIRLNTYMEAEEVRAENADVVIIATGSTPRMDGVQLQIPGLPAKGFALPHVISSTDLIMGLKADLGKSALVLDTVGHFEPIAAAEFLVKKGVAVTYLTHLGTFGGPYVQTTLRDTTALESLYQGDFTLLTRHYLAEIAPGVCHVRPLQAQHLRSVPADTVVLVTPNEPSRSLYDELKGLVPSLLLVGDSLAPRDLQAAIMDGHVTARAID